MPTFFLLMLLALAAGLYIASRCPLVRAIARLFCANAERHAQTRFQH